MELEKLKYPIGRFKLPDMISQEIRAEWISDLASFSSKITAEVNGLSEDQLNIQYRPGGWTIRQVIHHCADSHMNSFVRFKLALTESDPVIKPYDEGAWAELCDSKSMTVDASLKLIDGIHNRWSYLLDRLSEEQFKMSFVHPEFDKSFQLDEMLGFYAWHCNHHLAHIIEAKKSMIRVSGDNFIS